MEIDVKKTAQTGRKYNSSTYEKQHRRGRRRWGVGAARGRATGGCEEVRTGADSQCSQRGAFSLVGSGLVRVGPRGICVAAHYSYAWCVVQYDRLEEALSYLSAV